MKRITIKNSLLLIPIILLTYSNSYSFELDGFENDMSYEEVKEMLKNMKIDAIKEKKDHIHAYDSQDINNPRQFERSYNFIFEKNKLFLAQKNLPPSMKNFIMMFDKFTTAYGKHFDSKSEISLSSIGEDRSIRFVWAKGIEQIELAYTVFPNNDQLQITYVVPPKASSMEKTK